MKEVYDWCVTHNKKIIAVSDMYLSANVLNELLEENGFEVERILCHVKNMRISDQESFLILYLRK